MDEGEIHRKLVAGDVSVIRFTSYAFDLSVFSGEVGNPQLFPKDRTLPYLLNPDADDAVLKRKPQLFRAEVHRRFTEWLYPLVFAFIALAVTGDARSHREARVNPMVTAIVIALFVRWLGFFTTNQAQTTPWFWPFVYAVPLGSSLLAIWFIATNRSMELPVSAAERLLSSVRRLGDMMMFLRLRRSHRAAKETA
jgi:lipopolysaccharide export system permease protein